MEATLSLPATSEVKKDCNKERDFRFKKATVIAFQKRKIVYLS